MTCFLMTHPLGRTASIWRTWSTPNPSVRPIVVAARPPIHVQPTGPKGKYRIEKKETG